MTRRNILVILFLGFSILSTVSGKAHPYHNPAYITGILIGIAIGLGIGKGYWHDEAKDIKADSNDAKF